MTLVEHLRASRLVKKLEGTGSRGRQVIMGQLVPYPAIAEPTKEGRVEVRVLDFENMKGYGHSAEVAMQSAQDQLLRHLITALRDRTPVPPPNQYLDLIDESRVFMLDPLAPASLDQHL